MLDGGYTKPNFVVCYLSRALQCGQFGAWVGIPLRSMYVIMNANTSKGINTTNQQQPSVSRSILSDYS
jgi:hypothetical protein